MSLDDLKKEREFAYEYAREQASRLSKAIKRAAEIEEAISKIEAEKYEKNHDNRSQSTVYLQLVGKSPNPA